MAFRSVQNTSKLISVHGQPRCCNNLIETAYQIEIAVINKSVHVVLKTLDSLPLYLYNHRRTLRTTTRKAAEINPENKDRSRSEEVISM